MVMKMIKEIPKYLQPREKLKTYGVSNLDDKELLAIILRSGNKNNNVMELANKILIKYSLNDLKNTQLEELNFLGEVKAMSLVALSELAKRMYLKDTKIILPKLVSAEDIYNYTKYLFNDLKQEYFYALYFDSQQELIKTKLLFMGTVNKSITHPREIFKEAYLLSASTIVCMHNHPSGDVRPSNEDIIFTNKLVEIGKINGIPIVDHLIVSNNNYYSFYDEGNIKY
jgi:DNA repair protein RadC